MTELQFIDRNEKYWKELEQVLMNNMNVHPDQLSSLYTRITDDLSFAQTFYPTSPVVSYLNKLSVNAHQKIYKNKPEKSSRIIDFWKYEVPSSVFRARKYFLYSLLIFLISISIGVFSSFQNEDFLRVILGDSYVNITEQNIENEDPMAIYKSAEESGMFFGITTNNVRVSILVYVVGIFTSVAPGYLLFSNGIMVGAFMAFFVKKGLFWISFSTIFIHGALELSAIVIAGGAGIMLGNSFLFPGNYTRIVSLRRGANDSLKVIIGLVPVFVIAGFIESYVTRHYIEMGSAGRLSIIISSCAFIIWYFIIYPYNLNKNGKIKQLSIR